MTKYRKKRSGISARTRSSLVYHILNIFRFSNTPIRSAIVLFTFGITAGVAYEELVGIGTWHNFKPETDKLSVCFTPPSGCGSLIAIEIEKAQKSIYMQAYGLTLPAVIYQLKQAASRGVEVNVLLDGGNLSNNDSIYHELKRSKINVKIDKMSGIAHNKVIVIDKHIVITGSFNFTIGADRRNSENVVLIDDPNIANLYLQNWQSREKLAI